MSNVVPKTQQAVVFDRYDGPLEEREVPVPTIQADEVLVKILYSGVCHSDLHVWKGEFPDLGRGFPLIGGHEGAGTVARVGANVTNVSVGDRVGIKWVNSACLCCEQCKKGFESACEDVKASGYHVNGTFQQYATVKASDAVHIPDGVNLSEVAPLFCAGLTAYKAVKTSNARAGQIIAITGAGGGLGSVGIQYARALGLRVLAIDTAAKEQHCRSLGAEFFVDPARTEDIVTEVIRLTNGGPHAVVNFAPVVQAMNASVKYVRTNGTVVLVGLPKNGVVQVDVISAVLKGLNLRVSNTGSRLDMDEALDFFCRGLVKIPIEIVPRSAIADAFNRMEKGQINGRLVVDLWK